MTTTVNIAPYLYGKDFSDSGENGDFSGRVTLNKSGSTLVVTSVTIDPESIQGTNRLHQKVNCLEYKEIPINHITNILEEVKQVEEHLTDYLFQLAHKDNPNMVFKFPDTFQDLGYKPIE